VTVRATRFRGPRPRPYPPRRQGLAAVAVVAGLALTLAACSSSKKSAGAADEADDSVTVKVVLTSKGCVPTPASIEAGHVDFEISNKDAGGVTEAELRSGDGSHILGEQENLTPGLSGGFSLNIQPGAYKITCPGASTSTSNFTVTGRATAGANWHADPLLSTGVNSYADYVKQNVADLITQTRAFCAAITAGDLDKAKQLYSPARIPYEHMEPVAEIFGELDSQIDGRWENPITNVADFKGFHRIEQLMFESNTLDGVPPVCAELLTNEQQLQKLVGDVQYSPLEMAAGATDLVNEAATAKITGEEERYSNVDLPTFQGNVDGAMEVFKLLTPYLQAHDPGTVTTVQDRYQAVVTGLKPYQATPGYLNTGFVDYKTVTDAQRKQLSGVVNALAEALSKVPEQVS
jgi:iron uptake system component EfeO